VRAVCEDAEFLTARGIGVDLLTVNPQPWEDSGLPAAVRYWSLRRGEGYHPLPRGERLLVYRAPRKVLGLLRNAAEPHYGHPDLGRPLELAVGAAVRAHARLADGFHHRVFIRGYRVLRPYLLWRIASRDPGAALVTQSTERVVVYDTHAVPTAWHLARRHPRLQVDLGFDRARYGDLPVRDAQPQARPQAVAEEETAR
jgi:glycogen(starch) synthase